MGAGVDSGAALGWSSRSAIFVSNQMRRRSKSRALRFGFGRSASWTGGQRLTSMLATEPPYPSLRNARLAARRSARSRDSIITRWINSTASLIVGGRRFFLFFLRDANFDFSFRWFSDTYT